MGENTHSGHFSGSPTGRIEVLPVELRYWSFLAKSDRSDLSPTGRTATLFPVSTSFGILAITCSFLIRFE